MSWETLSKENAISMAELWQSHGKSKTVIREHLVTKGLTYPEADEVLTGLSNSPHKAKKDSSNYASLGSLANEPAIQEETPLSIAQKLWSQGKSTTFIRKYLVNTGSSNIEATEILAELTTLSSDKAKTVLGNYGSLERGKQKYSQNHYHGAANSSGVSNQVVIGLVIMAIGCGVTFFSYQAAASSSTGGSYVVAWGAIIFGGWRVLKGLADS